MTELGYIIVSNQVMKDGKPVGYFYREAPDDDDDSGWRVFSGLESDDYADEASNFALYNAATVIKVAPEIAAHLASPSPAAFERDPHTGVFSRVD